MATLVLEDGSQVPNSNAYLTEAEASVFVELRESAEWDAASVTQKEDWIIWASLEMDKGWGRKLCGCPTSETQSLLWPREGMYDHLRKFEVGNAVIHERWKEATAVLAWWRSRNPTASAFASSIQGAANGGPATIKRQRQKLDVLEQEIEYATGLSSAATAGDTGLNRLAKAEVKELLYGFVQRPGFIERG